MTPYEHNKTFCVCNGKETGEVNLKVTVYGLDDVLDPANAALERERQKKERERLEAKTTRAKTK